ncbi:hypothetical protein QLQ15_12250 [Lysobacter sp. LF1]|uniref:Uncharacterized protein n=1 Tax=Lysobacter stagni TaxID=3045172 RepID=A0ABT6XHP1_9GAMM|nr:hypothetical protein [Lysobacter sp. LF1]MDI9239676.1 hypothetical protein [Lysobacter sp. LF1]
MPGHAVRNAGLMAGIALAMLCPRDATAQYRQGMPEVLPQPARASNDTTAADADAFRAAYRKAGSPRMVVYWNRDLSDAVTTQYDHVAQATHVEGGAAVAQLSDDGRTLTQDAGAASVTTLRSGERRIDDNGSRQQLPEHTDWPLMTAFNARLQGAGAQLVDRTVALRAHAADQSAEQRKDTQTLELKALQGKAELLVEVLQTHDASSPFGVMFRVEVKRVATGELLASLVSDGKAPKPAPGRFVAGGKGYVREAAPEQTLAQAGDVVANATMTALTRHWQ